MKEINRDLERKLKEFLNRPIHRIGRGISKLLVFSETTYIGLHGITYYVNHTEGVGAIPMVFITLITSYGASKGYGYLYNKGAERVFKNKLNHQKP